MIPESEAQRLHDERKAADPEHDRVGCWCCCHDCDWDYDEVTQEPAQPREPWAPPVSDEVPRSRPPGGASPPRPSGS